MQTRFRSRLLGALAGALVLLGATVGPGVSTFAGGWAIGSLDSIPEARAGEPVEVGFTILQHGVRPAQVGGEVGIEIVSGDGISVLFDAHPDGAPGRYVASVTFPDSGTYEWSLRMGWFGDHDLGTIDVADDGSVLRSAWPSIRWGLVALGAVLGAVALVPAVGLRRRRPAPA